MSLLASCAGGDNHASASQGQPIEMRHARYLSMAEHEGYTIATMRNPWDSTRILQTYVLVPDSIDTHDSLPDGVVVRVPLRNSLVYTNVHARLVDDLGAADAIGGVCDAAYITVPSLVQGLANGSVADCGTPMNPNIERIIMLRPDAILLSAFENSNDHNKVASTGIPIIDCADYMEVSPLARAEWMRFFGRLYGKGTEADSMFADIERRYMTVKNGIADYEERPTVLFDRIYNGMWSVPGANSTTGILLDDAAGTNLFADYKQSGSVNLAPEQVLYRAGSCDVWLIRTYGNEMTSLASIAADNPMYKRVGALVKGNVYVCNTQATNYFADCAFKPHLMLAEIARLLHNPESSADSLRYYQKVK